MQKNRISLTKVGAIVSLISSSLLIILLVGAMVQSLLPERETTPVEDTKADITITIEPQEREDVNPLIGPIVFFTYFISCGLIIAGSVSILKKEKSKKALITSCVGSTLLLLDILYISRNCCGIILIIFPFTCIVGNILSMVGYNRENFEELVQ